MLVQKKLGYQKLFLYIGIMGAMIGITVYLVLTNFVTIGSGDSGIGAELSGEETDFYPQDLRGVNAGQAAILGDKFNGLKENIGPDSRTPSAIGKDNPFESY